jgi:uracil-DNA glycosylase
MHQRPVVNRGYLPAVQKHMAKWAGCTDCPLHQSCRQKVFFRGDVPCDVLIIGVGPLADDEAVGLPMKGDNGSIIDEIIDDTIGTFNTKRFKALSKGEQLKDYLGGMAKTAYKPLKTCITNSVLCRGDDAPDRENIRACSKRLAEFITIAKPRMLIAAGKQAGSAIIQLLAHLPEYPRSMEIRGPGFVARLGGDDREVEMARIKLSINKALSNVFGNGELVDVPNSEEE